MEITPKEFIEKWRDNPLTERQASHTHFIDLCHLLGEPAPYDPGTDAETYCFEKGAAKSTGAEGWADVWKRGAFGWEYKGPRKDLTAAYAQLQQYAVALENPPLLVVCDRERFRIHTNFTNSVSRVHEIALAGPTLLDGPVPLRGRRWSPILTFLNAVDEAERGSCAGGTNFGRKCGLSNLRRKSARHCNWALNDPWSHSAR